MDATKRITKNLGGDRLGSGDKNNISLHAYNRSTHDLSRAWRSSMNVGTLVPFFKEPALNGETWSIDLAALVRTIPTTGPIYGSFKLQMDMFVCPIRLYNGLLHNNMTKIGLKMEQVKLPTLTIHTRVQNPYTTKFDYNNSQISPSSLEAYLGLRGIGDVVNYGNKDHYIRLERKFQCVPEMAYFDIYKNYYANKQEEKGVIICNGGTPEQIYWTSLESELDLNRTFHILSAPNNSAYPALLPPLASNEIYQTIDTKQEIYETGTQKIRLALPRAYNETCDIILEKVTTTGGITLTDQLNVAASTLGTATFYPEYGYLEIKNIDNQYKSDSANNIVIKIIGVVTWPAIEQKEGINLEVFDLQNIDNARIAILRYTGLNNELSINDLDYYPYKALWEVDNDGVTGNINSQQGLAIKTYQSDILQNWLQTEWIDGTNGINEITAINVSSGSFTIDALNLANKVYNMLNRIAVSGGSYEDWQEAVYSTEAVRRAEQPIYVGGMSCEVVFEEVIATAETESKELGGLAGRGTIANKRGGQLEIRIDEPSYIIGIASLTPRIDYSQGNDWDRTEVLTMNDWHKPALDGIGFEDLLQERAAWWGTYYDVESQEWVKLALGKTPAWMNYMTAVNKTYGDFAEKNKNLWMTLNRQYEYDENGIGNASRKLGITDNTTYIDPTKYNYAFADDRITAQNFWVQIGVQATARRVMSAKQIPSL